MIMGGNST